MGSLSAEDINTLRHNARNVIRELGLLNDAYFEIGVTLAERHLLIELSISTSPTMGEIAERLLIDKSTVSRLISKAVKKGYIKCVADKKDKRKRFLHLTEKGKQTLSAFEPIAFNQTKDALSALADDEIDIVYRGMALYAEGLKNSRLQSRSKKMGNLLEISMELNALGFSLELFDQKDEEGLYKIFQEVVEAGNQFPYESSSTQEFHRQFFCPNGQVYVCRALNGEVVGGFYLKSNFSGRSSHIANAAYMIQKTYRGKGIGSLLIKASLQLAQNLGFQAMQFNMVLSTNILAIKLYEKLGFTIAGTIPRAVRNPDGTYQDGYVMHLKF